MAFDADSRCPCGSGDTYGSCCGRFHLGLAPGTAAPTAEALMRSRYSAFAVGGPEMAAYLLATWHPSTRPATLELDAATQWRRLDVVRVSAGGPFDSEGTVDFAAHWRDGAARGVQREHSRFIREGGRWFYLDGDAEAD
ncbi:SEC-C motif-containing protein [Sinomonas atrocyanea]|uniref:YchJ family protein n=1 Tax=Sinomonas atrocyanea TaxID=37927 RepID=UPI002781F10C|nr:YchJ family protein [Sinomonas atrocyanea]MDP9882828.1 SEC-C motif-containing protein [Sinomonas atrocyanea]